MQILYICSSRLGLPALNQLAQQNMLPCIGVPDRDNEETAQVLQFARVMNIPVQRLSKKSLARDLKKWIKSYQADLVVTMTFPWKVPAEILRMPSYGFYNFHYARLPEYRGPQPLFWVIRNREAFGAVTIHKMDKNIDTGGIALIEDVPLLPEENYAQHTNRLAVAGLQALGKFFNQLLAGQVQLQPQDKKKAKWWPQPDLGDTSIDWNDSAAEILALIKACNPWNKGAFCALNGSVVRITEARISEREQAGKAGEISLEENECHICAGDGKWLTVDILLSDDGYLAGRSLAQNPALNGLVFTKVETA